MHEAVPTCGFYTGTSCLKGFEKKGINRSINHLSFCVNSSFSSNNWQQTHTCGRRSWQIPHTQFIVLIILYLIYTLCANVLCRIRKTTKKFHSACGKKWKRIPQPNAGVLTSEGLESKSASKSVTQSANWFKIKLNGGKSGTRIPNYNWHVLIYSSSHQNSTVHVWDVSLGIPT